MNKQLILASSSIARLSLLKSIQIIPDAVKAADIDETPQKKELPAQLVVRLARAKALKVAHDYTEGFVIAADTITTKGRTILPKALTDQQVIDCLKQLSGCRSRVYTSFSIIKKQDNRIIQQSNKLVVSIVKLKRLTTSEIEQYVLTKEGLGKSGGCNIEGYMSKYITWLSGSYSNIIGLPLYEVNCMLTSLGYFSN